MLKKAVVELILAILSGAAGVTIAVLANFPAPYLTGPALFATIICLLGIKLSIPNLLRDVCFVTVGIGIGSTVTPDVMGSTLQWPISFMIMSIVLVAILFSTAWVLQTFFAYDRQSSYLASSPGHLSYIMGLSLDVKADTQNIVFVQSMRVLILTLFVPFILSFYHDKAEGILNTEKQLINAIHFLIIFVVAFGLGTALRKINTPAAYILSGILVPTFSHLTNLTSGYAPEWATLPAFLILGTLVGTRFYGVKLKNLQEGFSAGVIAFAIAAFFAVSGSVITSWLLGIGVSEALVAFAPGGAEAMMILAVLFNLEPNYVAAHHIFRLVFLMFLIPIVLAIIKNRKI